MVACTLAMMAVRTVTFRTLEDKARWIDANGSLDARLPGVRTLAARYASSRNPNDHEGLARSLHAFVRDAIRYVRDPSAEEISDAETILARGWGDCDDKVRLLRALYASVQIPARVRAVFPTPDVFSHVQLEVRWPGSDKAKGATQGGWLPAELIVDDLPLGELPRARGVVLR